MLVALGIALDTQTHARTHLSCHFFTKNKGMEIFVSTLGISCSNPRVIMSGSRAS